MAAAVDGQNFVNRAEPDALLLRLGQPGRLEDVEPDHRVHCQSCQAWKKEQVKETLF